MLSSAPRHARNPLALGWEAARANVKPALVIQVMMAVLLAAYYLSPRAAAALSLLADYKQAHGTAFVVIAAVAAGAILPEFFLIVFFQRRCVHRQNLRDLAFTIPLWAVDGILVDWLYRLNAFWFGDVVTVPVVIAKICVDQFVYNTVIAAPSEVLVYGWKNCGISWASLRDVVRWDNYLEKVVPTLFATWAVWIPILVVVYSLPLALQFPLFSLALTFWVLLLIYMTNRFAGKSKPQSPVPLIVPAVEACAQ
jgi:hypothetical protein